MSRSVGSAVSFRRHRTGFATAKTRHIIYIRKFIYKLPRYGHFKGTLKYDSPYPLTLKFEIIMRQGGWNCSGEMVWAYKIGGNEFVRDRFELFGKRRGYDIWWYAVCPICKKRCTILAENAEKRFKCYRCARVRLPKDGIQARTYNLNEILARLNKARTFREKKAALNMLMAYVIAFRRINKLRDYWKIGRYAKKFDLF